MKTLDDDSQVFPCDVSKNGKPRRIYTTRVPLKLISAITPFNHPMNQVVHKIAPAIATNNTVVLKPSEKTPLSAYYFAQLALDCGLPANMLNVINGEDIQATAEMMTVHPDITMVSFTGSSEIGKIIAKKAGYKKIILELGGSSALLVLKDADIDEAVTVTMAGTFKNSAQRCTAIRRILVHHSIADKYAEKLATAVKALKYGDPYNAGNDMGTIINEASAIEIEKRVQNSIDNGAVCLTGHKRNGAIYAPTVLDHVKNNLELVAKETFGPVAPIIRFETLDEAIKIANDTPYGLSGGVVSNHWPSIQRVINELDTGTINVNEAPSYRLEWTPFGGVKDSGLGYKEGVIETMKGPATTTDTVKYAQAVPDICPREKEFGDLMEFCAAEITKFVGDTKNFATVFFGGSGTATVEAILSSVVPEGGKILIIDNGAYGKRMCQITAIYKIDTVVFKASSIEPIDLKALEKTIQQHKDLTHLAMIHHETTTGLLNDIGAVGLICKKYELSFIVDSMSGFAAIPVDMAAMNIDYLAASSNKNIQGMAGIGFAICNKKALGKTKNIAPRNLYLNLYAQYEYFERTHQTRFTPPVQTFYALKQAILETQKETIEKRYERNFANRRFYANGNQ
uniref:NADP-dependent glyceraldehyde-3-phosphate dehydrogenase n=1 Tax=Stylophora pistillata TaxID=50429 RepID=A0A2B4RZ71_STYPI